MNEMLVREMVQGERRFSHAERPFLEGADLCKVYRNGPKEVRAIDGVSMRLVKGEFLAVVGPSGAGKSTLLHLLGGLDKPTSGRVLLDGFDVYVMSETKRAFVRNKRIGFVFQFYHLLPEFTALENVLLPALIGNRTDRKRAEDRAKNLLEAFGLKGRLGHRPRELSGGESQRVAIARALINEPDILLCDEPTGNLDSKTGQDVIELLMYVNEHEKVSLVIATHDNSLKERADSILHIKDGRLIR